MGKNLKVSIGIAVMTIWIAGVGGSKILAADGSKKLPVPSHIHFFVESGHLNLDDKFITGPRMNTCDFEGRKRYKIWKNESEIQVIMFNPWASWLLKDYRYRVVSIKDVSNGSIKDGLLQNCGIRSIKEVGAKLIP